LAESLLASHGIRVITWADSGHRSFSNSKRPLRVPQNVRGLRIRSPETVPIEDWMKTLGIDPVVLSFPEMAPALQQGVVDGQDIELASARMLNLHKSTKILDHSGTPLCSNSCKYKRKNMAKTARGFKVKL